MEKTRYGEDSVLTMSSNFGTFREAKLPAYFFKTTEGNEPVRSWLKALSKKDKQKNSKNTTG